MVRHVIIRKLKDGFTGEEISGIRCLRMRNHLWDIPIIHCMQMWLKTRCDPL